MRDYLNQWTASPSLSLEEGYKVAQEAVARNDSDPYAHWALGSLYLWLRRHDEAEQELKRAISLNPSFSLGYTILGLTLHYSGRSEMALDCFERAIALDPYTDVYLHFQSQAYFQLGRYEKTVEVLKRRLTRHPNTDISRCYWQRALVIWAGPTKPASNGRRSSASTRTIPSNIAARCCLTRFG